MIFIILTQKIELENRRIIQNFNQYAKTLKFQRVWAPLKILLAPNCAKHRVLRAAKHISNSLLFAENNKKSPSRGGGYVWKTQV